MRGLVKQSSGVYQGWLSVWGLGWRTREEPPPPLPAFWRMHDGPRRQEDDLSAAMEASRACAARVRVGTRWAAHYAWRGAATLAQRYPVRSFVIGDGWEALKPSVCGWHVVRSQSAGPCTGMVQQGHVWAHVLVVSVCCCPRWSGHQARESYSPGGHQHCAVAGHRNSSTRVCSGAVGASPRRMWR